MKISQELFCFVPAQLMSFLLDLENFCRTSTVDPVKSRPKSESLCIVVFSLNFFLLSIDFGLDYFNVNGTVQFSYDQVLNN